MGVIRCRSQNSLLLSGGLLGGLGSLSLGGLGLLLSGSLLGGSLLHSLLLGLAELVGALDLD